RFNTRRYLSRHSDLVALMVLEHELRMQNLITRANYETRLALDEAKLQLARSPELNEFTEAVSNRPVLAAESSDWKQQRIAIAGEMLLEYMLFRNEAVLKGPVKGTSDFAKEFQRG